MSRFKILIFAAEISLIYNTLVLISVFLNLEWVRLRAAGGQYDSFPIAIRFIYLIMAGLMIYLMVWLWIHRIGNLSRQNIRLVSLLKGIFILSTFMQLISRSSAERINAIPAALLALTFWRLQKRGV